MQIRFRASAVGVAVLAFGMIAGPAFGQTTTDEDVPEGFESEAQCLAAVRQIRDEVAQDLGISDALFTEIDDLLQGGASLGEVCTFYIPTDIPPTEVEGEFEERPEEEEEEEEEGSTPGGSGDAPGRDTDPAEVLGETLSRTGVDATLLAVMGASLLGLGVVAVRRTRRTDVA